MPSYCIKNNYPNNNNTSGSIQKRINIIKKIIINFFKRIKKTKTTKRNIFYWHSLIIIHPTQGILWFFNRKLVTIHWQGRTRLYWHWWSNTKIHIKISKCHQNGHFTTFNNNSRHSHYKPPPLGQKSHSHSSNKQLKSHNLYFTKSSNKRLKVISSKGNPPLL